MKIGFNMFLWTGHVTEEHTPILRQLKDFGYDGVQVPVIEGEVNHYKKLGVLLEEIGLEPSVLSIIPDTERNIISADPQERANGLNHLKWAVDCTKALGATQLGGPLYQTLGHFSGAAPTEQEFEWAIEAHRAAGDYAQEAGIKIVLETVNRFESYLINTMGDLKNYLERVNHPAVTGMYDTFHANLEEKDVTGCIRHSASWIEYVHISENDRGTPGKGHIDFPAVFKELKAINYDGWLTIEAFGRALPQLAAATKVWRDFFPSTDEVWQEGFKLIRDGWDAA